MPNIAPLEVGFVCAAVLLLGIAPAVLAWSDDRRRRKLQRQAAARDAAPPWAATAATAAAAHAEPLMGAPSPERVEAAVPPPEMSRSADRDSPATAAVPPGAARPPEAAVPYPEPSSAQGPALVEPVPPSRDQPAPLERPAATAHYQFRLQDLRRARLPHWPPAAVRDDPERNRLWREGERAAAEHAGAIQSAALASPQPAQSTCFAGAEEDGAKLRLRFLLFPELWPVEQGQAVAVAVFEIDRSGGELHSWVEGVQHAT